MEDSVLSKKNLIDYWIPDALWVNRDIDYKHYKNAKVLISFLIVGVCLFLLYALLNCYYGHWQACFLSVCAFSTHLILLFLYKKSSYYKTAVYGFLMSMLFILFIHQLHSEPFLVSHMVWIPIFPMLGAMLLGMRTALFVSFLTLTTFLGSSLWVEYYGAIQLLRTNNMALNIISIILCSIVMFVLVYLYDRSKYQVFELLERKNKELENISEDNRLLTAIVTHDLSNPLMTMGIYTDKLRGLVDRKIQGDSKFYEECTHKLNHLSSAHQTSLDLVRNVKNTLALQMEKINISLEVTDLYQAIKDVLDDYQYLAKAKKISITINRMTAESFNCLAEPNSLRTSVLSNLISNAIKFSHEGSSIDINLNKTADKVELEVRDYGVGITQERMDNLFELRYTSSRTGTLGERGTGYGLPIVKSFVEKFRGDISIDSKSRDVCSKSCGTRIRVSLLSV